MKNISFVYLFFGVCCCVYYIKNLHEPQQFKTLKAPLQSQFNPHQGTWSCDSIMTFKMSKRSKKKRKKKVHFDFIVDLCSFLNLADARAAAPFLPLISISSFSPVEKPLLVSRAYMSKTRPLIARLDNGFLQQCLLSHTIKILSPKKKKQQRFWQKISHFWIANCRFPVGFRSEVPVIRFICGMRY